ncbi:glutathione ABC transporter substrate-binding protein [Sporosarcina sp. NCCP-2222]|uniref:glutathione ABC transporter substrate-binding protein n=1 Tax=Sporosarcina sp. NCCP-2222 TaxID=2935073 RepID=UPI00208D7E5A|nr:glutathione ABC transporter substrate-binding protein [Sporosarcina sp. NCCP-2222]GKV57639.1 glutathione ABC transporter substrate-binding protein [Sporosarcina sp. NCCP-2222]
MKSAGKAKWLFVLVLAFSMILAACGGGSGNKSSEKENGDTSSNIDEGKGEGVEGGDLVLAVLSDASSLDPAGSNDVPSSVVQANIYETLVNRDDDNKIIEGLATSWEAIDDTTYEFKLREGVTFHDGEPFNAEAVKVNLERILDPEVASPRYFLYEMITEIIVKDEYTVQIKTEYPFAPLLAHLSHNGGSMVSPKSIEADYAAMKNEEKSGSVISTAPVGTGYFKFDSWTPGSEIKLVRNDDYWGDKVHVDTVTFKVVPESGTRNADLETGYVHIADPVQPNEVADMNAGSYAKVNQQTSSSLAYLGFNTEKEPFNDPKVRKAISMLVNKDDISEGVYDGFGVPAKGPLAPGIFGYNEDAKPVEYNPEEAKKLLEEAGYGDGFKTSIWTNDNPQRQQIAVLVQEELKKVNIEADINVMEFGAYLDKTAAGEHEMFILGWSNSTGDADYGMYALFHSSQKGDPGNRSFYENPEVDKLLEEGRRESDPEKRIEIYNKVQEHLIEDAPMVYLIHTEYLTGVSNKIKGFSIDTSGIYQLKNVQFVE